MNNPDSTIRVGARSSPLSRQQVEEVKGELAKFYPQLILEPIFFETTGDRDLKTSLRSLEKTDFFTKEIDQALLNGQCQVGVHSAKDLPDPLPFGLKLFALTTGQDPADVLVLREGETLESLEPGAVIATSSERREQAVCTLRPDLTFMDLRGTIGQRLKKLETFEADGVVVAEAALIRLKLTHLNRIRLPGPTVPFQGQLAIIGLEHDVKMQQLFSVLDTR